MREFLRAFGRGRTYNPLKNAYVLLGFFWGLPIPFFSIALHAWACRDWSQVLNAWAIHLFFIAHPLVFAIVFGAMATVRHHKEIQIAQLVRELKKRARALAGANEQLKELDRLKAEFMANVTHELKTPLVAIRGYNESILEERFGPLTAKQRDGLEVSVRNVDRLQKLIEELLEFERLDSGEFKLAISEFDLVPLVRSTLKNFEPQIEEKKLAVELRLPESLHVRADREKIGRVVLNLVSNAVKFTDSGKAFGINARAAERALITVWDRGPGIPSAAQKFLFTRFWQADGSARRRHGGTGLGLAICKEILDAHGSTLQIVSTEGAGTMVHFDLSLPMPKGELHDERRTAHSYRG